MIFIYFENFKDACRSIRHFFRAFFCQSVYYYLGFRWCDNRAGRRWCTWQCCPKRRGDTENE